MTDHQPPRCTGCGLEDPSGAELCVLCRTPRPRHDREPVQWLVSIERGGAHLVSVWPDHIEVARENGPSRWSAPVECRRVAS